VQIATVIDNTLSLCLQKQTFTAVVTVLAWFISTVEKKISFIEKYKTECMHE
jgi:hypothetical protein